MFYYYIYNFKKLIKKKNKILTVLRLCGEFLSSFLYFYPDFFLRPAFSPPPSNFFSFFFIKDFKKIFSRHRDPRIITNVRLITNFFFFFSLSGSTERMEWTGFKIHFRICLPSLWLLFLFIYTFQKAYATCLLRHRRYVILLLPN